MNIYVYNSSTINEYSDDDCGLISSMPIEILDCGKINDSSYYLEFENYYFITCSETLHPFGSIKVSKSEKTIYKKVSTEFIKVENLNKKSIMLYGIILRWYGCGTLFEINDGLIRQLVPDVSGGGIV